MRTLTEKFKAKVMCNFQLHSVKNPEGMTKTSDTNFEPKLKCSSFITINLFIHKFFTCLTLDPTPSIKNTCLKYIHIENLLHHIFYLKKNICYYFIVLFDIFLLNIIYH